MNFKNILVPTDFSDNSVKAYEFSLSLARINSSRLHILHIVEPLYYNQEFSSYTDKNSFDRDRTFEAEEELERFINKYSNAEIEIERAIRSGKAHEEIINYSKENETDLIVISTHGWKNLHTVTGSVTKKVLNFSKVPVLCIKANVAPVGESYKYANIVENWVG
ncbi:MAG TPA: universal stress protein [Ignavibacteriaceae bacterium]|nr:universal stress protein [Ignavibacteriaceae bacterium]